MADAPGATRADGNVENGADIGKLLQEEQNNVSAAPPSAYSRADMFADAKQFALQLVKEEVLKEAFAFADIPHRATVRSFIKSVRELSAKCPDMEGLSKIAMIETSIAVVFDLLGVATRENFNLQAVKDARDSSSVSQRKQEQGATEALQADIDRITRQLKKETQAHKDMLEAHVTMQDDLREEKTQVRLLSQKLSDMRERHQAKDERMEDELRALNTRHERDLAQLKRKFRLEKQDEIEKMMEKVTNDLKRQQGLDRTRSSEQAETFWKTRFETLEFDHKATTERANALTVELGESRKEAARAEANSQVAHEKESNAAHELSRVKAKSKQTITRLKEEVQDLKNDIKDLEKRLAKEKKKEKRARDDLKTMEDQLSVVREEEATKFALKRREMEETTMMQRAEAKAAILEKSQLQSKLASLAQALETEKQKHKKSKAKFSTVFNETKVAKEQLREHVAALKDQAQQSRHDADAIRVDLDKARNEMASLRGELAMAGESQAAAKRELERERLRNAAIKKELAEVQFTQLQGLQEGGETEVKLATALAKVAALETALEKTHEEKAKSEQARQAHEAQQRVTDTQRKEERAMQEQQAKEHAERLTAERARANAFSDADLHELEQSLDASMETMRGIFGADDATSSNTDVVVSEDIQRLETMDDVEGYLDNLLTAVRGVRSAEGSTPSAKNIAGVPRTTAQHKASAPTSAARVGDGVASGSATPATKAAATVVAMVTRDTAAADAGSTVLPPMDDAADDDGVESVATMAAETGPPPLHDEDDEEIDVMTAISTMAAATGPPPIEDDDDEDDADVMTSISTMAAAAGPLPLHDDTDDTSIAASIATLSAATSPPPIEDDDDDDDVMSSMSTVTPPIQAAHAPSGKTANGGARFNPEKLSKSSAGAKGTAPSKDADVDDYLRGVPPPVESSEEEDSVGTPTAAAVAPEQPLRAKKPSVVVKPPVKAKPSAPKKTLTSTLFDDDSDEDDDDLFG